MILLVIAVGGLSSAVVSSIRLSRTNEESAIADDAARRMIADLRTVGFLDIFASFNTDPGDDPSGAGSGPGPNFAVVGLTPRNDDADGLVGEIRFPTAPLGLGLALNENSADHRDLGLPRDLNGDGDTTDLVQTDYLVLPVIVRIQWTGSAGRSFIELRTVITE
jgi:hypothetical protein